MVGAGLLIAGSLAMLAYLGLLGSAVHAFVTASTIELEGSYIGLGLASLRLIPSLVFNHGVLFSLGSKFLLLFSAFAVAVAGLGLLQNRAGKTISGDLVDAERMGKGDH